MVFNMQSIKNLFHVHKYKTLIAYRPEDNDGSHYGFLIQCDCGHYKLAKIPRTITEVFTAVPVTRKGEVAE